jgi:AcrR family transcriptional regulator
MSPSLDPASESPSLSPLRARTRSAIVEAALRLFARQGVGGTAIHEIAGEAGVSNGSFYNYFRTREDVLDAGVRLLAKRLTDDISASYADVSDPAERVAIGSRRFMLKALAEPEWGAAVLRVWNSTPLMAKRVSDAPVKDLRAGRRKGRFSFTSERAAVDLLQGTVLAAMRTMLEGGAGEEHSESVAAMILRGLGLPSAEAKEIARRPLPPLTKKDPPRGRK